MSDTGRQVGLAYHACDDASAEYPKRISYLIGGGGEIERAYPDVRPAEHPDQVLRDVDELLGTSRPRDDHGA